MSRPAWADAFLAWLATQPPPASFGQLALDRDGDGWRVRRADDDPAACAALADPGELRRTAEGRYRPNPLSPDLRGGWIVRGLGDDALLAVLDAIYPAAAALVAADRAGRLRVVSWREVQRRQTGQQGLLKRLADADCESAIAHCCSDATCLRRRLWDIAPEVPSAVPRGAGVIPCYEPCSLFCSHARRVLGSQRGEGEDDE